MRNGVNFEKAKMVAASVAILAGCNPFHHATKLSNDDPNYGRRWHASLVTPKGLQGVAQITGNATWGPAPQEGASLVKVSISNATPGGQHPWALHHGQCGNDAGVIGSPGDFPALHVGNDGTASQSATLAIVLPRNGEYFVSIEAAATNAGIVVACGNLSPPVND